MAKRTVDLTWVSENYGEREAPPFKRTARPRAPPKRPPPLYTASVKELAETGTIRASSSTADIDNAIIQRIKKCLERANHPNTPEAEAKAALHLASRLMGQYNVSQAEVLAHEPPSAQRQYAGQSVVSIQRVDGDKSKTVNHQSYVDTLCHAMKRFFDCKYYSTTNYSSLELTFYGIAENTVAAAMSFETAYNLIAEWARPYKGVGSKNSYSLGVSDELNRMAVKEKAAEEVQAEKAEGDAIAAKRKQEEAERQAQLGRLAPFPEAPNKLFSLEPAASTGAESDINGGRALSHDDACNLIWSDSERIEDDGVDGGPGPPDERVDESSEDYVEPDFKVEDEYNVNSFGDLDEEISKLIKPEPLSSEPSFGLYLSPPTPTTQSNIPSPLPKREPTPARPAETEQKSNKPPELEPGLESQWASQMQLVTFRATATKIADEYLEDRGVTLHNRSARSTVIRDRNAYSQGVKDSKKIDVYRKRINE
ncbi:MAG: hypothetical protein CL912_29975 [Deltaproteobacteria bacterium]|mgnify:CR=1 FL=1|uniref:DUF2786 domain-containing protein n=1 Tax=Cadophora malorum TaxID=108018 RepID=A0A8H7W5A3_9HELO|nr:hypothetical protein IFR04_009173 [Cadophora malorum]MAD87208.1 hypothetical protein [Deltaproteobacteria bacterium]